MHPEWEGTQKGHRAPCSSQQPKLTPMTKRESSQPKGLSLTKGGVESTDVFGAEVSFLSSTKFKQKDAGGRSRAAD